MASGAAVGELVAEPVIVDQPSSIGGTIGERVLYYFDASGKEHGQRADDAHGSSVEATARVACNVQDRRRCHGFALLRLRTQRTR